MGGHGHQASSRSRRGQRTLSTNRGRKGFNADFDGEQSGPLRSIEADEAHVLMRSRTTSSTANGSRYSRRRQDIVLGQLLTVDRGTKGQYSLFNRREATGVGPGKIPLPRASLSAAVASSRAERKVGAVTLKEAWKTLETRTQRRDRVQSTITKSSKSSVVAPPPPRCCSTNRATEIRCTLALPSAVERVIADCYAQPGAPDDQAVAA